MTQNSIQHPLSTNDPAAAPVTAGLLVIGDEILSGRVADLNIAVIAKHLTSIGVRLREVRVVGDVESEIISALNVLRGAYDYVFTTGGIGPTHDDITVDAVGKAFGAAVELDPRSVELLREHYSDADLTPARLRMARLPEGGVTHRGRQGGGAGLHDRQCGGHGGHPLGDEGHAARGHAETAQGSAEFFP